MGPLPACTGHLAGPAHLWTLPGVGLGLRHWVVTAQAAPFPWGRVEARGRSVAVPFLGLRYATLERGWHEGNLEAGGHQVGRVLVQSPPLAGRGGGSRAKRGLGSWSGGKAEMEACL